MSIRRSEIQHACDAAAPCPGSAYLEQPLRRLDGELDLDRDRQAAMRSFGPKHDVGPVQQLGAVGAFAK
jgi:hypothetical protein